MCIMLSFMCSCRFVGSEMLTFSHAQGIMGLPGAMWMVFALVSLIRMHLAASATLQEICEAAKDPQMDGVIAGSCDNNFSCDKVSTFSSGCSADAQCCEYRQASEVSSGSDPILEAPTLETRCYESCAEANSMLPHLLHLIACTTSQLVRSRIV